MSMVNMKIGTPPLRWVKTVDQRNLLTFPDFQDNSDAKDTSLSENFTFPEVSHRWRLEKSVRPLQQRHSFKTRRTNSQFEKTSSTPEHTNVSEAEKSSIVDNNLRVMKTASRSQNAKQKVYLKMILSRPHKEHIKSNDSYVDEDYIRLNDELFSSYLSEEGHRSAFTPTNLISAQMGHSSSTPTELRSGVISGKCRLRRKYTEVGVETSDRSLVKYDR